MQALMNALIKLRVLQKNVLLFMPNKIVQLLGLEKSLCVQHILHKSTHNT
jgi:hypothetical protein